MSAVNKELRIGKFRRIAGAGGDWPVINERLSADVVRQSEKMSCVSACGEMLSNGALKQDRLIEKLGAPCDQDFLARQLGPGWAGGYVGPKYLDSLLEGNESWAAELRDPEIDVPKRGIEASHEVVVDGLDAKGNLSIRDPKHGTMYEMKREDFLHVWTGRAVIRR